MQNDSDTSSGGFESAKALSVRAVSKDNYQLGTV